MTMSNINAAKQNYSDITEPLKGESQQWYGVYSGTGLKTMRVALGVWARQQWFHRHVAVGYAALEEAED